MAKKPQPLPVPQSNEQVYAHAIATELRRLNELLAGWLIAESQSEQKTPHRDEMRFRP